MIELTKRYLKDLLAQLQILGVSCVDESVGDRPVQLVELLLRRNLHIHSRGIVDERYLEADPDTGKPRYNLYNLKLGAVAYIDNVYFITAGRLCSNCVDRLARWSEK